MVLEAEDIMGVRVERAGPLLYCLSNGLPLQVNEAVMVETEHGPRLAWVAIAPGQILHSDLRGPLPSVLRKATPEEVAEARRRLPPHPAPSTSA